MSSTLIRRCIGLGVLSITAAALSPAFGATNLVSHPLAVAVRHGDCVGAVKLVNPDATQNDADTSFIAGRMLEEGICVHKDEAAAVRYLSHAAELGEQNAGIDYASKFGLGEQETQSYERAGMLCREAGIDPKSHVNTYALGYACTVSDLAAELLRESLPKGAFRPNSGQLLVAFTPGTSQLHIKSTPHVGVDDTHTGSNLRTPLIDASAEVQKAWRNAVSQAPKPDTAQLGSDSIELPLDVDMTLEVGRDAAQNPADLNFGPLMQGGDVHRGLAP